MNTNCHYSEMGAQSHDPISIEDLGHVFGGHVFGGLILGANAIDVLPVALAKP